MARSLKPCKWSCSLQSKDEIRKRYVDKRRTIDSDSRHLAAHSAAQIFLDSSLFQSSHNIACYLAKDEELSTRALIQLICHANKTCFLPILSDKKEKHLEFAAFLPGDPLQLNKYKIFEPEKQDILYHPQELDLVFVPLVAFDKQGIRIGMGGGYYDRTFAFRLNDKKSKPKLIGVGFALQEIDELPCGEWDVPLDGVLTEKELIIF